MKNSCFALLFFLYFLSCTNQKIDYGYFDLSKSLSLMNGDTIDRFDNKQIFDITVRDSVLFVSFYNSDTCIGVINISEKKTVNAFGIKGNGPSDLLFANFILTTDHSINPYIQDSNHAKMLKIIASSENQYQLEKLIDYPSEIFSTSSLNYTDHFIVGRKIGTEEGDIFIFNRTEGNINYVNLHPEIDIDPIHKSYFLASVVGFNEKKGRIIAGMYFLDMFHVLNLNGKIIKTITFSNNSIPQINKKVFDLSNGFSGFFQVFITDGYCYLLRKTESIYENKTTKSCILLQINWDGEIINSYAMPETVKRFCVDSSNKKLYVVTNEFDNLVEFDSIVAYEID